ncbi:MAG: Zn-ribbon domain-containing OB-fold protein [Syntrophaceae bacterium]
MAKKETDTRFSKFGTVSFTGISRINDFIGHLEGGKLMGTKCKKCGVNYFPPRADCCKSLDSDMEWFEVKGSGKLLSFSTLTFAPTGFTQDLPYTIGVLDFGGYKVFGRIDKSVPETELAIGMDMKTAVTQLPNGQLSYVFEKA